MHLSDNLAKLMSTRSPALNLDGNGRGDETLRPSLLTAMYFIGSEAKQALS